MSDPLNSLGSILYHSEPMEIPYFPNQYLVMNFFCDFLQQTGSIIQERIIDGACMIFDKYIGISYLWKGERKAWHLG